MVISYTEKASDGSGSSFILEVFSAAIGILGGWGAVTTG